MKKNFLKTIAIGLFLLVIPAKIWAQEKNQIKDHENGFLFNVFEIENVEERIQLASALATSDIWICNPTDNPGELFIRPNSSLNDIPIYAEFDYLRMILKEEYKEVSSLPKEEFSEVFNSWAHNISDDYYNFLISDHLDRANHCGDAEPFCTSNIYDFPAYGSGFSWSGPNYGCLGNSPTSKQSFWYYMRIGVAGNITIKIQASFDVDFALWGPFNNETEPCPTAEYQSGMLTANCSGYGCPNNTTSPNFYPSGNLHDCSFDGASYEYAHVVNGQVGQYFILLITNYGGGSGNITFQKYAGNGETDCSIMPPVVDNGGPYCVGETITLTGNAPSGATYAWSGPGNWHANGANVTRPNCTMANAGTYTCTITLNGQQSSAETEVAVYANPTNVNFTASAACVGEATQFSGSASTNPSGHQIQSYAWEFGDGSTGSGQNVTHTYSQPGTYNAKLTVSTGGHCTAEKTKTVTVYDVPNVDFTATTVCAGQPTQFTSTATPSNPSSSITNWHWDFGDGSTGSGNNVSHTYSQAGRYQVTHTASCGGSCSNSVQHQVVVNAMPNANAGTNQSINYGASTQLHGTGGNSGSFSYHWEPANKLNNANIANPQTVPLTETTTFTLTVTNPISNECFDTDEVTVNIHGSTMTATGSASPDVICAGSSTQLNINASSGTGQYTYAWNPTTGLNNPTSANPTATPQQTTTYTCTVNDGMTSQNVTVTVTVFAMPMANAGDDRTISYGQTTLLEGSGGVGTFSYHWEPANMVISPNAQNTSTVGLTASQTFTLTVTNPDHPDCVSTAEVTVSIEGSDMTINPNATPSAICEGENTAQLNAHAGGGTGNFEYAWSPETGLDNPHSATPIASPTTTTTYSCTVSDGFSSSTKNVTVTVYHPETADETHYTCANEPFLWHGQYYSAEGNYEFDTLTNDGCRKTINLHLHHYPIYDETLLNEAICSGETYDFFGTPYGQTNNTHESLVFHDEHTLSTIHGCDSIVRLNLTIYPENEVDTVAVEICPEQTYVFYGTPYSNPIEIDYPDHDIHGCDSVVKLILSVGEYFIPATETHYIAYDDQPSFTWDVNGVTYTTEGHHVDTLETDACKAIYSLNLFFKKVPDPIVTIDTACDSYTWTVLGVDHPYSIPQGSVGQQITDIVRDNLAPYHYEDGRPSYQDYYLNLQMYKTSDHESDFTIDGECNSYTWQYGFDGQDTTYTVNGSWTKTFKSKLSNYHCDSIVTLTIQNMRYNPNPYDTIFPTEPSTIMSRHYDTAYVITNTEFFSFIYDFYVNEKGPSKWGGCIWEKSPWCDWEIAPYTPPGETVDKCCKVYVGQRYENPVELTCKIWNDCMAEGDTLIRKLYLKSSFLDVDEQQLPMSNGNVEIIPNPNNGQMRINFENMEGHVNVKVFDMTGRMVDGFETSILSHNQSCDYHLKNYQDGVYFFIISNERQFLTRKVVLIR